MNIYVVIIVQLLFASATHIAAKAVITTVDAGLLTLLRNAVSTAGFLILLLIRKPHIRFNTGDMRSISIVGFLIALNQFLYLYGMKYTTAANGALLYAFTPIFVLLLARFYSKEKTPPAAIFGIILAFSGVTVVIFEKGISMSNQFVLGNIIVLCAVLTYALFTILGKPLVISMGTLPAAALANAMALIWILPFELTDAVLFPYETLFITDWIGILYLGIGTSIIGYLLWYYALRRISAARLAVFANGQPIIASILSVLFLGATISFQFIIGGIITITGVILTQRK